MTKYRIYSDSDYEFNNQIKTIEQDNKATDQKSYFIYFAILGLLNNFGYVIVRTYFIFSIECTKPGKSFPRKGFDELVFFVSYSFFGLGNCFSE